MLTIAKETQEPTKKKMPDFQVVLEKEGTDVVLFLEDVSKLSTVRQRLMYLTQDEDGLVYGVTSGGCDPDMVKHDAGTNGEMEIQ